MRPLKELVDVYQRVGVYERITQDFNPNCCIVASLVTERVFRYFNCDTDILTTQCYILNGKYGEKIDAGESICSDEDQERWAEEGCYSVIIGDPTSIHKHLTVSHLINVVQRKDEAIGIDASIQQAHRPHKGIVLEHPLAFPMADTLVKTNTQIVPWMNGCRLVYLRINDNSFTDSPDWLSDRRWRSIAGEVIREMKARLG